jgi:hypothetical protein
MYFPLYPIFKTYCRALLVVNFITFVLSRFRASLLATGQKPLTLTPEGGNKSHF